MPVDDIYTVALLHMNEADGSTNFVDESGKTWTANGNAQIDTAQSVFGGASMLLDGNDWISTPDHADWQLDGGSNSNEWTIDFRVRFAVDPGAGQLGFFQQWQDNGNFWSIELNNNNLRIFEIVGSVAVIDLNNAWNPAIDTWYHVAVVKQGTTGYKVFINGTQIGSTQTDTSVISNFTGNMTIGRFFYSPSTNSGPNGWMDEVRISKGIARWTANFTPPTSEYSGRRVGQRATILGL